MGGRVVGEGVAIGAADAATWAVMVLGMIWPRTACADGSHDLLFGGCARSGWRKPVGTLNSTSHRRRSGRTVLASTIESNLKAGIDCDAAAMRRVEGMHTLQQ